MTPAPPRRPLLSQRSIAIILVVVGVLLVGMFGLRAFRSLTGIRQNGLEPGPPGVERIRGWMTVPHVADIYDIPASEIFAELGIPQEGNAQLGLEQIARQYNLSPDQIRRAIDVVLRRHHPDHPALRQPPGGGGRP